MESSITLTLSINLTSPDTFDVTITEPESMSQKIIPCHFNGETMMSENIALIAEIRSWASMVLENSENEENC